MKKYLALFLTMVMGASVLAGCGGSDSAKTFTVGFDAEYPPYGYRTESGDYAGFEARVPFGDLARRSGIGRSRFRPRPRHDGRNATTDRRRGNQNQQCLHTKANVRNRMRSGKRSPPKKLKIGIIRIIRHEETRNRLHTAALPRRAGRGLRVRRPLFRPAAQTLPLGVIKPALASALDFSYL